MKKYLILLTALIFVLTGCSEKSEKESSSKETKDTTNVVFENLIDETKRIRESKEFGDYKNIVYSGSPYDEYTKFYAENEKGSKEAEIKIQFSDYKLIEKKGNLAAVYIGEKVQYKAGTSMMDNKIEYYYIFKKQKNKWKIYDYVPTNVAGEVKDVLQNYK